MANGDATYNSIFGLSYFDPSFFTKVQLDAVPSGSGAFQAGKYVFGLESNAYGVVEGSDTGVYSIGQLLYLKTLSGRFLSGETIRDEDGNTAKFAKDNTISHFVVQNRGLGYADGVTLLVNGLEFDSSKIAISKTNDGKVFKAIIADRNAVSLEYAQPPAVTVKNPDAAGAPNSAAAVVPVLFRNSVTTYTPQNVKSLGCSYGSGNSNNFSADVVVDSQTYSD